MDPQATTWKRAASWAVLLIAISFVFALTLGYWAGTIDPIEGEIAVRMVLFASGSLFIGLSIMGVVFGAIVGLRAHEWALVDQGERALAAGAAAGAAQFVNAWAGPWAFRLGGNLPGSSDIAQGLVVGGSPLALMLVVPAAAAAALVAVAHEPVLLTGFSDS